MDHVLVAEKEIEVRFNEVDLYNIVWHGNYVIYLEAGRQSFANRFGFGAKEMLEQGYYVPLVNIDIQYRKPLVYNDVVTVFTKYRDCRESQILFDYEIVRRSDSAVVCTASTRQVIVGLDWELKVVPPPCLMDWKMKWLPQYQALRKEKVN